MAKDEGVVEKLSQSRGSLHSPLLVWHRAIHHVTKVAA